MLMRQIGGLLRGRATPFQLVSASVLGATLGVTPGFAQSPGLHVALLVLLLILNANLFVAASAWLLGLAAGVVIMPICFWIGRALLDGPTQPLFVWMINAPVLALFGFEHYATSGALVVGPALGAALGIALCVGLQRFRAVMANLEEGSERYKRYASKRTTKIVTFLVVGRGHGKKTYRDLMERRGGSPVRVLGIVFAVLAIALGAILLRFASGPIVTAGLRRGLERANGATVDIATAEIDLAEGRLVVTGLAMADPNALDTDLLRAERVEVDVTTADLLRKRIAMDRVVLIDAQHGATRIIPGRRTKPAPEPDDTPDDAPPDALPGGKDIEEYIRKGKEWKERLAQVRRWLEEIAGDGNDGATEAEREETLRERLRREVRELGWGRVRATHLIEGAPTVLVRELIAEKVRTPQLIDETLDIRAENLSTQPRLVDAPTRISVTSSGGTFRAGVELGRVMGGGIRQDTGADTDGTAPAAGRLTFALSGLPADTVAAALIGTDGPLMRGGTLDASADGTWTAGLIDLPLQLTIRDTTLAFGGAERAVRELTFPVSVKGPLDRPSIQIDDEALTRALTRAGADELADRLQDEFGDDLEKQIPGAGAAIDEALKKGLGGLFGDKKKDDDK